MRAAAPASASTSCASRREIKRRGRLHDAALQPLRGPVDRGEPRLHRARLRRARSHAPRSTRRSSGWGSSSAREAARRHALGRLEAAARARRLPAARARSCCCSTSRRRASIPSARREFWDQIHELAAEGMTVLVSTHYMDEAERCHRLAYIAYGKLLAQGTADEVVRQSGLHTWAVERRGPRRRSRTSCARAPGVEMVAAFGERAARERHRRRGARRGRRAVPRPAAARAGATSPSRGSRTSFIQLMQQRAEDNVGNERPCSSPGRRFVAVLVEGVRPDAPRPAHLRHDGRHADHAAHPVRLRDQHATRRTCRRRCSSRPRASSRASFVRALENTGYFRVIAAPRSRDAEAAGCSAGATSSSW